jgi:hypothetical protein
MQGTAVADITHMLAELIENAVLCSRPAPASGCRAAGWPPGTSWRSKTGGLGIPPDTMAVLNQRAGEVVSTFAH